MPAIVTVKRTPIDIQTERELALGLVQRIRVTGSVTEITTCAIDGEAIVLGKTRRLTAFVLKSVIVVATDEDSGEIVYETREPIVVELYEGDVILPPEETLLDPLM